MPIPFTCPHCGLHSSVADERVEQIAPCSKCGFMPGTYGVNTFGPDPKQET